MVNRHVLLASLLLLGCKDKGAQPQDEPTTAEGSETQEPATQPELPAAFDAAPILTISESPISIFEAKTNSTQVLHWAIQGEDVSIRAEATAAVNKENAELIYDLQLYASMAETEDAQFFTCKGLKAKASAKADLVLRGDMLHVLCINTALEKDPGTTDAARFALNLGRRALVPKGTYGGDGSLDLDTIDLDEGE